MNNQNNSKEQTLDMEWVNLMLDALDNGISIEDVRQFIFAYNDL